MTTTEPVLVDPTLDRELQAEGLVQVPILTADEVAAITEAYWAVVPEGEEGLQLDFLRDDRSLVRSLNEVMAPVWARTAPRVFANHRPIYSSFVVKHPGPASGLYLHRDMTVDDERQRPTYAVWMPLVDTSPELDNGPLAFVRGSEHIAEGQCGPTTVMGFSPYCDHLETLLEIQTVAAGTALVYDARMLHASAPNLGAVPRLAVGCLLARQGEPIVQVLATGRRGRQVHQVDADYFLDHVPAEINRHGMPDSYPVLDRYEEEPVVDTHQLLGAALHPEAAVRTVLVPEDLRPVVGAAASLAAIRDRWTPTHTSDVAVRALDLTAAADGPLGGLDLAVRGAPVGTVALVEGGSSRPTPPTWLPPVDALLADAPDRVDVLVLDPLARITLTAPPDGGPSAEVVVIECTHVRSGACVEGAVVELDLGMGLALEPGRPLHLWNEGPGPTIVAVRQIASMDQPGRPLRWQALRQLTRRWGTRRHG